MFSLYNKKTQLEIPSHNKQAVLKELYKRLDDEERPFYLFVGMSHHGVTTITIQAKTKEDTAYFHHLLEECAKEG